MNCIFERWDGEPRGACPDICPHDQGQCERCGEIVHDDDLVNGLCTLCQEGL